MSKTLGTGAEMSRGHFGTSAKVSRTFTRCRTGAEMSNGHFGTSANMSWVRSVLGPKCPYTIHTIYT